MSPQNKTDFYVCNEEYRVHYWDGRELIYPFEMFFTLNNISFNTNIVSVVTSGCSLLVHYTEATKVIETLLYNVKQEKRIVFNVLCEIINSLELRPKFRYKYPFSLLTCDNKGLWYYDPNLLLPCLM